MRRFLAAIALSAAMVAAATPPGLASFWVGYDLQSTSGGVIINLFGMNGLSWDQLFRPVHEVEALDLARRDLVRRGQIRDFPVLIVGPWHDEPRNRISIEPRCEVAFGDAQAEENRRYLGQCYRIELARHHGIDDQLALMMTLPRLSAGVREIEVGDLRALRASQSAALTSYKGLILHFDPVWSPEGNRLLYTAWTAGTAWMEILEPGTGVVVTLESLEGYMVTRPVWSADSRFVAYAALGMVKVYDTHTRTTQTFRPRKAACMETLIESEGSRLRFAFDSGCWNEYEIYLYDVARRELQRLPADAPIFEKKTGHDLDRHASLDSARSPNGRWIAVFAFIEGQRRIRVSPLR